MRIVADRIRRGGKQHNEYAQSEVGPADRAHEAKQPYDVERCKQSVGQPQPHHVRGKQQEKRVLDRVSRDSAQEGLAERHDQAVNQEYRELLPWPIYADGLRVEPRRRRQAESRAVEHRIAVAQKPEDCEERDGKPQRRQQRCHKHRGRDA